MRLTCRLWPALEEIGGAAAVLADWRSQLGQDFDPSSPFLRPTDHHAESYPDTNDPFSYYQVVWHSDDDIVGVHSRDGSTIRLAKSDVLIYRLDTKRLFRNIAEALGFCCDRMSFDGTAGPLFLGTYRPCAGFEFPAYFSIPHESADLQRAVETVAARSEVPFMILTPTARRMRPDCSLLLKSRNACFLPLADAVTLEAAGQLLPTPWAEQTLEHFCKTILPKAGDHPRSLSSAALPISSADNASIPATRAWPDPKQHTTAKAWTVKDGRFCLSTKTDGRRDGRAVFEPTNGKPTNQMQFMRLICFKHPNSLRIADILEQVYAEDTARARRDPPALARLLKRVRSLVSDIRNKKLIPAGINPGILPPLSADTTTGLEVTLRVARLHRWGDIGFEEPTFLEADPR